jgi:hypothetical protein
MNEVFADFKICQKCAHLHSGPYDATRRKVFYCSILYNDNKCPSSTIAIEKTKGKKDFNVLAGRITPTNCPYRLEQMLSNEGKV